MKNYLKDLEKELKKFKINDEEIKDIINDHLEMLEEAKADGVSDQELNTKFGTPESVAKQIYTDSFQSKFEDSVEPIAKPKQLKGYELVKAFPVDSSIECVKVSLVSEDVIYLPYEGESIQVFAKNLKKSDDYQMSLVDGVFVLKRTAGKGIRGFFNSIETPDFGLMVPLGLEINIFEYHSVSGDGLFDNIVATKADFKTTSGDVEATNIIIETELKLTAVSGDFEVNGVKAENLEISLVSGDVEMIQAAIEKEISINSVSGDTECKDVTCQHIKFRTVSGDFEGHEVYPDSVEFKSVSGDFEIENTTSEKEIVVTSKKTLSGDVTIK